MFWNLMSTETLLKTIMNGNENAQISSEMTITYANKVQL